MRTTDHSPAIKKTLFGNCLNNKKAYLYKLTNKNNHTLTVSNYGANITALEVKDKFGQLDDIVLGYDTLAEYKEDKLCLGALIGRVAGRISGASFSLNNQVYPLSKNHGEDHIHGGFKGFNHKLWSAHTKPETNSICFSLESEDGEEGYPGKLSVNVTYTLTENNQVIIHCSAHTNKTTVVNLTQHAYFNLNGHHSGDILDHKIQVSADKYLVWDENMLPSGEIKAVKGTPLNLTKLTTINSVIRQNHTTLMQTGGIDHYWLFDHKTLNQKEVSTAKQIKDRIKLYSPASGRHLTVSTDQVGSVIYTGNHIPLNTQGKKGQRYHAHSGVCIEPQAPTNAVNRPEFPQIILTPEESYQSTTVLSFTTD